MVEILAVPNLDIFFVGLTAIGIGMLGTIAYLSNPKSITNKSFFFLSIFAIIWGILNLSVLKFSSPETIIWILRISVFFALWYAFFLFQLFYVFPKESVIFPDWYKFGLIPLTSIVSFLVLTPLVFVEVTNVAANRVAEVQNGPGIVIFGMLVVMLNLSALTILLRKTILAQGSRLPYFYIFCGAATTHILILVFNFIFPAFLNNTNFIPYTAMFSLFFIFFTLYAVIKHKLLNIRVGTTEILIVIVATAALLAVFFAREAKEAVFHIGLFFIILIFGFFIIRNVMREIQQREKIEKLAGELAITNKRQEELMHFIGHEVKGFLTKSAGAFAALKDGDYGKIDDTARSFIGAALEQTRHGADAVTNLLIASNLNKGTIVFDKEFFDLAALLADVVQKLKSAAAKKGLALSLIIDSAHVPYMLTGDKAKIGDYVLRNLIDNAINYTPSGAIDVSMKKEGDKIVIAIKDTGVGITEADKLKLFTEGGRGSESHKINALSTGYGLFIAKNVVVAHNGTVRAESDGEGKGATFVVELPAI